MVIEATVCSVLLAFQLCREWECAEGRPERKEGRENVRGAGGAGALVMVLVVMTPSSALVRMATQAATWTCVGEAAEL